MLQHDKGVDGGPNEGKKKKKGKKKGNPLPGWVTS